MKPKILDFFHRVRGYMCLHSETKDNTPVSGDVIELKSYENFAFSDTTYENQQTGVQGAFATKESSLTEKTLLNVKQPTYSSDNGGKTTVKADVHIPPKPANWALNKGELHTGKSKGKSGYMTGAGIDNSNIMLEESTGELVDIFKEHNKLESLLVKETKFERHHHQCITCTLVTSKSHVTNETYQVAVIANGHIPSISDYEWSGEDSQWVISTFHTKQPTLVSAIAKTLNVVSKPSWRRNNALPKYEVIQIHQGFFARNINDPRILSKYLREARLVSVSKKANTFKNGNITVSTDDIDRTMRFVLKSFGDSKELDAVRGLLTTDTGGQCSHIHDSDEDNLSITENISDQLSSLERPNDTMPITIMCISHQRSHKKALTLYYCIASGDTSENISGYSAQWTISKVRLNNDALHDKIVSHWSENFLRKLTTTQRQNWKENSPAFLATDSFPFSDDSIIGQLIPAEKNHVRNQAAYTYSHQEDSSLYIRLFTPRSPPRVEVAGASKDSADIRLIKIEGDPYLARKKALEDDQSEIFQKVHGIDDSTGDMDAANYAMTILAVSVATAEGENIRTTSSVFCLKGVALDTGSKLRQLELHKNPSWVVTTRWIKSCRYVSALKAQWTSASNAMTNDRDREILKAYPAFGILSQFKSAEGDLEFVIPDMKGKKEMVRDRNGIQSVLRLQIEACGLRMSYDPVDGFMLETVGKQSASTFRLLPVRLLRAVDPVELPKTGTELISEIPDIEYGENDSSGKLTIIALQAKTRVKANGKIDLPKVSKVYLVSNEVSPNIDERLQSAVYQDPMTSLHCVRVEVSARESKERKLSTGIRESWNAQAEFSKFLFFEQRECNASLLNVTLKQNGIEVRNDSKKNILSFHAHNARTKPLLLHILDNHDHKQKFCNIAQKYETLMKTPGNSESAIKAFISSDQDAQSLLDGLRGENIPTSFKHPTIKFTLNALPLPNQLCVATTNGFARDDVLGTPPMRLESPSHNDTHIRFSQRGNSAQNVDENILLDLIQENLRVVAYKNNNDVAKRSMRFGQISRKADNK